MCVGPTWVLDSDFNGQLRSQGARISGVRDTPK